MARAQSGVDATVREMRLAASAFRALDRAAQQRITRDAKTNYVPMLGREVVSNAAFVGPGRLPAAAAMDQRNLFGANPGVRIGGDRTLSGGAVTGAIVRATEFGAYRELYTKYESHSKRGVEFDVTRRAVRQFRNFQPKGYYVYKAIAEVMPKVAAMWVAGVSEEIEKAMAGRSGG